MSTPSIARLIQIRNAAEITGDMLGGPIAFSLANWGRTLILLNPVPNSLPPRIISGTTLIPVAGAAVFVYDWSLTISEEVRH